MSSMGSYYTADYYQNPTPYESSDIGEPVPGWGTTVSIAGPARLGVGAIRGRAMRSSPRRMGRPSRTAWQKPLRPATLPPGKTPPGEMPPAPCVIPPASYDCSQVGEHRDALGIRLDVACNSGKVMRYEKGAMPSGYVPTTTSSLGAYGQTGPLNIRKAAEAVRRLSPETRARLIASRRSATTRGAEEDALTQPGAPGEPLPWWIWPAAAAVVLGGVGYYGTKKGWF